MDHEFAGKAALITGASKGIGRAGAEGLAPEEVDTMVAFLTSDQCSYNSGSVVTIDAGV